MKYLIGCTIVMITLAGFETVKIQAEITAQVDSFTSSPVVIVELFTSQGCSSCPAADRLLNEVITTAKNNGSPVIGLSYHVSYWNYLGWKDPYSSEVYTERQKAYARVLQLSGMYTPQMIVNGTTEFVGSDSQALKSSISKALKEPPVYFLEASATMQENEVTIHYSVDKEVKGELLNVAMVESYVQNEVPRGENKGLTLKHYNVVRKLETKKLQKSTDLKISVPPGANFTGGTSIVLYIQDPASLKVLGASSITIRK